MKIEDSKKLFYENGASQNSLNFLVTSWRTSDYRVKLRFDHVPNKRLFTDHLVIEIYKFASGKLQHLFRKKIQTSPKSKILNM